MTGPERSSAHSNVRVSLNLLVRALVRRGRRGSVRLHLPPVRPGPDVPEVLDMSDPILSSALDRVADRLEVQLGALHIPGLSAAIVYNQETAWARGFGIARLDSCVAADEHTIYHQASIGKLFTNTMMMQLRDDGVICLDDPIERYVPGFKLAQQANGQQHSSPRSSAAAPASDSP